MKVKWMPVLLMAVGTALGAAGAQQQTRALTTEQETRSYALGMDIGAGLRRLSIQVDPAMVARGLADALAGGKTLLTEAEAKAAINRMQVEAKAKQILPPPAPDASADGAANKRAGALFLAQNKTKPGVVTLPSGLQYRVLTAGQGNSPTVNDIVVCQYRGTLIDGTEFDSTHARGQAATFAVKGVIAGWTEALQLMTVGSKWQLFIPPELAYGARGAGDRVGPNATLIFEIELLSIK
jgi:FKBP-type peptidyl-prolyl cis-trans isomerase FklB